MATPVMVEEERALTFEEIPSHVFCIVCYPEPFPGMRALCGAELLGIPAPYTAPVCDGCDAVDEWEHEHIE